MLVEFIFTLVVAGLFAVLGVVLHIAEAGAGVLLVLMRISDGKKSTPWAAYICFALSVCTAIVGFVRYFTR